ncbi:DUF4245 domain-containing protein [Blastococcus sp. SYSU D00820]
MTAVGPSSQSAPQPPEAPAASPAVERANRMSAANMLRSLLPLVLICLAVVGWMAFRNNPEDPVIEVDPSTTVSLAANRADYAMVAPQGLPGDYRPTSARTDAGGAGEGDPVTLEIGYLTPSEEFAGFVVSDDPRAAPVADVLDDAADDGTVRVAGTEWTRGTTAADETVLYRQDGDVIVLVTGSAPDAELEAVAGAVAPVG